MLLRQARYKTKTNKKCALRYKTSCFCNFYKCALLLLEKNVAIMYIFYKNDRPYD
jgi:hypothetical protein